MITARTNARIFDRGSVINDHIAVIQGERIQSVGGVVLTGASVKALHNAGVDILLFVEQKFKELKYY